MMGQLEEEGLLLAVYVMYCVILVVLIASIALCFGEKHQGQRYRYFYYLVRGMGEKPSPLGEDFQ